MLRIAALGDRNPEYLTHREIDATLSLMGDDVDVGWVATGSPQADSPEAFDGVWLLPGTPYRNDAAAYAAVEHCLRTGLPFLGTCGGFQYACVQLMRSRAGVAGAAHAETDPAGEALVVVPLACALLGEVRTVTPVPGSRLAAICGAEPFEGFHFCGYGLAAEAADTLRRAGVGVSGFSADAGPEAIELPDHPFFIATAFQPQVGASSSERLHPLIAAFLACARARAHAGPAARGQPTTAA